MIRFVYDNNVLGHLIDRPDYAEVKSSILQSIKDGGSSFYYSEMNFWELFKGVNCDNFPQLRRILEQAFELCGQGNVLVNPHEHLAYSAGILTHAQYCESAARLLGLIRRIIQCADFSSFHAKFGALVERVRAQVDSVIKDAHRSTSVMRERLRGHSVTKSRSTARGKLNELFFRLYYEDVAKHFRMESAVTTLTAEEVASKYPSLKYYSDIFHTLLIKRMNRKNVDNGDYFDLEMVAYLDICDYIVTDDRPFIALFEESGTADLRGRAIRLPALIEHLEGKTLANRPVSPVWKKATKKRITASD